MVVEPPASAKTHVAKVPMKERKGPAVRVEYLDETEEMDFNVTSERVKVPLSAEVFDIMLSPPESPVVHFQPRGELEAEGKGSEVQQIQALGASLAAEASTWKLKSSLAPSVTQPVAPTELDALVNSLALDGSFISNPMAVDLTESDGEEPMEFLESQDHASEPRGRRAKIPRRSRSWLSRAATVGKVIMKTGVDNGEFARMVVTNVLSRGYSKDHNAGGASDEMEKRQDTGGTETTVDSQAEKGAVGGEANDGLTTSALDTFLTTSELDCPESHRE